MTDYDINDDDRWEQVHRERVRMQTQLDRLAERVEALERTTKTSFANLTEWSEHVEECLRMVDANREQSDNVHEIILKHLGVDMAQAGDPPRMNAEQLATALSVEWPRTAPTPPPAPAPDEAEKWEEWVALSGRFGGRFSIADMKMIVADACASGLTGPDDRAVQKPNAEDMAETICQWQNVLGSEGLARKLIALYWRGAEAGEGTR